MTFAGMYNKKRRPSKGGDGNRKAARRGFKDSPKRGKSPLGRDLYTTFIKNGISKPQSRLSRQIYAPRLIPFRSKHTLGEEAFRSRVIEHLGERKKEIKVTSQQTPNPNAIQENGDSWFYMTALQGEVLDVPLKIKEDEGRVILAPKRTSFFQHYSKIIPSDRPTEELSLDPFENGNISKALGSYQGLVDTERIVAKTAYKVEPDPSTDVRTLSRFWMLLN